MLPVQSPLHNLLACSAGSCQAKAPAPCFACSMRMHAFSVGHDASASRACMHAFMISSFPGRPHGSMVQTPAPGDRLHSLLPSNTTHSDARRARVACILTYLPPVPTVLCFAPRDYKRRCGSHAMPGWLWSWSWHPHSPPSETSHGAAAATAPRAA